MNTKQLRQKILDLAIHGKLTQSNVNEWEYVPIGKICKTTSGGTPQAKNAKYYEGGVIPWLQSGELHQKYIYDTSKKITEEGYENSSAKYYPVNSVLIALYGATVGEVAITKIKTTSNQAICAIFPSERLNEEYLYYFLKTQKSSYINMASGGAQPNISQEKVKSTIIPLPPLSEQKRIVERVELLLKEVEAIEKAEGDIKQIANILRSKVLDLAIKGQLTGSDTTGWKWEKHNNIVEISGGSQPPKSTFINEPKEGYIRLYQIRDYGDNPVPVYIPISKAGKITKKGDILLARYGASLGKVFWAEDGAYNVAMAKAIIKNSDLLDSHYLFWYYHSNYYRDVIFKISRSAQDGFNKNDIAEMVLPLPPLSEQKRIVEKIEQLFAEIDVLTR